MNFFEEAKTLLQSGDPKNEQLGTGLAILALCEKLDEMMSKLSRLNNNSLASRKPEPGDTKEFYCKVCKQDHIFTFRDSGSDSIGKNWHCSGCGKILTCSSK
jgi:hypothetical protein